MEALTRADPDNTSRVYPKLLHHWTDDRQLHVKVLATQMKGWDFYSSRYFLDLGGAKSVSGKELDSSNSRFIATVHPLTQLWRFSIDGQKREKLTDFTEPYNMVPLDELNKNILLSRASHYCECDGVGLMFYSVYELEQKKVTHYPLDIQITTNYRGSGSFIADSRGFFFEQPIEGLAYPASDSSHSFQLDKFVFGASFSKDHETIILALGDLDQTEDFDLMIISLDDNKQQRYPGVIRGHIPEDQAFGTILPITFRDDGTNIYFHTMNKETYQEINFYYEWDGEKVIEWQPPAGVSGWTFFTQSSDNEFRLYANGGLYKNNQFVETPFDTMNYYGIHTSMWLSIELAISVRWSYWMPTCWSLRHSQSNCHVKLSLNPYQMMASGLTLCLRMNGRRYSMSINLELPNNIIVILTSALGWVVVILLVLRHYLKQSEKPPIWKVLLITLIGLFSFTTNLNVFGTPVKIPILPLGVWIIYGFLRNTSWGTYRVYAWIGFWANLVFLATALLVIPVHHWVYPKAEVSTYIANVDHAELLRIHPSAVEGNLNDELLEHQLEHLQLTTSDPVQWAHNSIKDFEEYDQKERFPYQLLGTLPKWGSGLSLAIYMEDDGHGILITTEGQQYYYRSEEPLIEGVAHREE